MSITLAQANRIIDAALAHSTSAGYRPMAVVVLDDAGHIKSAQRQDGASMFRIDIAAGNNIEPTVALFRNSGQASLSLADAVTLAGGLGGIAGKDADVAAAQGLERLAAAFE